MAGKRIFRSIDLAGFIVLAVILGLLVLVESYLFLVGAGATSEWPMLFALVGAGLNLLNTWRFAPVVSHTQMKVGGTVFDLRHGVYVGPAPERSKLGMTGVGLVQGYAPNGRPVSERLRLQGGWGMKAEKRQAYYDQILREITVATAWMYGGGPVAPQV